MSAGAEKAGTAGGEAEAKRTRVKRLLLEPLAADGMRCRRGTPPERERAFLDRIADDLAYLSDDALAALRAALPKLGEGAARCFWPEYVTFRGLAHAIEPAPFEDDPALVRWFRSAAGKAARAEGRAVAEYLFFKAKSHPPLPGPQGERDRAAIERKAGEMARRCELAEDRIARGVDPGHGEAEWLDWYRRTEAHVLALIGARP